MRENQAFGGKLKIFDGWSSKLTVTFLTHRNYDSCRAVEYFQTMTSLCLPCICSFTSSDEKWRDSDFENLITLWNITRIYHNVWITIVTSPCTFTCIFTCHQYMEVCQLDQYWFEWFKKDKEDYMSSNGCRLSSSH